MIRMKRGNFSYFLYIHVRIFFGGFHTSKNYPFFTLVDSNAFFILKKNIQTIIFNESTIAFDEFKNQKVNSAGEKNYMKLFV